MDKYTIAQEAYEKGYEAGKPKWIRVEDRLPEVDYDVLVKFGYNLAVAYWDGCFWNCASGNDWYTESVDSEPTHWMPLPEPPDHTEINVYDKVETIENCTVQILTNTATGESSVGWWRGTAADMPGRK